MKKLFYYALGIIFIALLTSQCSSPGNSVKKVEFKKNLVSLFTGSELEKVGFQHLDTGFSLKFIDEDLYLKNSKDLIIAKYRDRKIQAVYNAEPGQAPGEFMNPALLFFYKPETLAVHDLQKKKLVLFDRDLNYLEERTPNTSFFDIKNTGDGFLATLRAGDKLLAKLDGELDVVETFLERNKKLPFEGFFSYMNDTVRIIGGSRVARCRGIYLDADCSIDIYDVDQRKTILTLQWKRSYPAFSSEDYRARRNFYTPGLLLEFPDYYVVGNTFLAKVSMGNIRNIKMELLIFDKKGKLLFQEKDFPYKLIHSNHDSRLFFYDNEDGISYVEIKDIME